MHISKSSLNVFLVTDYFRYNDKLKMKVDVMIFYLNTYSRATKIIGHLSEIFEKPYTSQQQKFLCHVYSRMRLIFENSYSHTLPISFSLSRKYTATCKN